MTSSTQAVPVTRAIHALGQSAWLDFIERRFLSSGGAERMVRDGWLRGVTSNLSIFQQALSDGLASFARDFEELPASITTSMKDARRMTAKFAAPVGASSGLNGLKEGTRK
ncbi:MAG: hypothetical protein R3B97_16720 [Dehalococcoidia bacterium]|nr:hypothetical protein [Dehalococcoidia bacterium]MCB9486961.1 hypothetical protein [Thermoflexaceae bacterium]